MTPADPSQSLSRPSVCIECGARLRTEGEWCPECLAMLEAAYRTIATIRPERTEPETLWSGWALRVSFVAGVKWGERKDKEPVAAQEEILRCIYQIRQSKWLRGERIDPPASST